MKLLNQLRWLLLDRDPRAQRIRRALKILLLAALFLALFWVIPVQSVLRSILSADVLLFLLGYGLSVVLVFFSTLELEPLARNQGIHKSLATLLEINLGIKFYLLFASSGLVGSGIRWYRLSQPEGKSAEAFVVVMFYRLLDNFLIIVLGMGFWLLSGRQAVEISIGWIAALVFLLVFLWFAVTRWSWAVFIWFKSRAGFLWEKKLTRGLMGLAEKLLLAVRAYAGMPLLDLLLALFAGIAAQLIGVAANLFIARSVGIQLSFLELGWITSVVNLATELPFAVAGGLGIREVTLLAILPTFGISGEVILAYSLLLFARTVLVGLTGGALEAFQTLRAKSAI